MKMKIPAALTVLLLVGGCQTAQGPLPTNEFTFSAGKTRTKEAIIATFMSRNYQIVKDSEFQLVLDRPANDSFGAQFIYGSQWNSVPNARVILTVTGDNPTKVNSLVQVVTNPGSGFERINDFSQNADARASIVKAMDEVKNKLK